MVPNESTFEWESGSRSPKDDTQMDCHTDGLIDTLFEDTTAVAEFEANANFRARLSSFPNPKGTDGTCRDCDSHVVHDHQDASGRVDPTTATEKANEDEALRRQSLHERVAGLNPKIPHDLGILGEELAAHYLEMRGYEILERNWRTKHGEVDIVARDEDDTILVEVKTRLGNVFAPEEAVDQKKIARYRTLCLYYLIGHPELTYVRFDVIAVNVIESGYAGIHHIMGATSWDS